MDEPTTHAAPPVVAVMVVHEPGPWFAEALDALAGQDYPHLRLLFLLTGEQPEVAEQIAREVPDALVRSLGDNPGFGPAANEALKLVEGAGFFCFLHDDVALERDAISELVAETYRSNAGVVGPKLLDWDQPGVLQHVGLSADRLGVTLDICELGELDQEQHDAVRDVFSLPTACLLVRIDLFRALGGFASDIDFYGDDLDLCWRAHLSGARVLIVPDARARHRERLPERRPDIDPVALAERHGLRSSLSAPSGLHLIGLLVLHAVYFVTGAVVGLVSGHARQVRAMVGAGFWQLVRLPALFGRRRRFHAVRTVSDAEVASLQGVHGSARLRGYRRQRVAQRAGRATRLSELGGDLRAQIGGDEARINVVAWTLALLVLLIGSRELLLHGVPRAGELLAWPAGPFVLAREYFGGWWSQGLGGTRAVPSGMGLSALLGLATFGADELPRTLLTVAPLFVGALGVWRLARPLGSSRSAAAALAVYVVAPLASNSIGTGSLSGLLTYAALPWVVHELARIHGAPPYGYAATGDRVRRLRRADVVVVGLVTAATGAFVPVFPLVVVGTAVALALGSLVSGARKGAGRMVVSAVLAAAMAFVLNLPWALGLVPRAPHWTVLGVGPRAPLDRGLDALAGFDFGPNRLAVVSVLLALPLVAALLTARDHRFAWAGRATVLGAAGLGTAWLVDHGTIAAPATLVPVFLTAYALALAIGAACFVAAFYEDVRGMVFSWRQVLGFAAFGAIVVGALPLVPAMATGRWELRNDERSALLGLLPAAPASAESRVLWVGEPEDVPVPGWPLHDGLVYALADDQDATLRERWREEPTRAERLVAEDLDLAANDATDRVGRLLGPMAIRFVLIPVAPPPDAVSEPTRPALLDALDRQLDLRRVELGNDSLIAYENTAWLPVRAVASGPAAEASKQAGAEALIRADYSGAQPALDGPLPTAGTGPVDGPAVLLSEAVDHRWQLTVDGQAQTPRTAFGWATAWDVASPGTGALRYNTSTTRHALVIAQVALWVLALLAVRTWRHGAPFDRWRARRRVAASTAPTVIDLRAEPAPEVEATAAGGPP
jgi:GT2 family glycosyltransferase